MRKILTIFILTFSVLAHGNSILDSLFLHANEAYSKGEYEEAFSLYKQIQNQGYESPDLYYNMGNAAYRSNKLGYAILYYETALKLDPSFEDAQKNLDYVSIYKEDKLNEVPEFFIKTWIRAIFKLFSLTIWSYITLILFGGFLVGVIIYIFAARLPYKKAGFFLGIISVFFFIISVSATIDRHTELKHPDKAVIVAPSVVVKSSPSQTGTDLFVLHEGTLITLDDNVGEWIEIRISDGRVGWILKESLQVI